MSQTIDNLNTAVVAALAKISELYDENGSLDSQNAVLRAQIDTLQAQVATYADLEARATALEAAAAADAAAEQDATDKLTAGVAAATAQPAPAPPE